MGGCHRLLYGGRSWAVDRNLGELAMSTKEELDFEAIAATIDWEKFPKEHPIKYKRFLKACGKLVEGLKK